MADTTNPQDKQLSDSVAGIIRDVVRGAASGVGTNLSRLRLTLPTTFAEFVVLGQERTRNVKIILKGDDPLPVSEIYVPLSYSIGDRDVDAQQVEKAAFTKGRIVVSGSAGSGKSIFLKHLGLISMRQSIPRVPMFFELRQFNNHSKVDLLSSLRGQILPYVKDLSEDLFKEMLESGRFAILLDGYDEVNFDLRSTLSEQISQLSNNYPKNPIVITTRPDEYLEGIAEFSVYKCKQMTLSQLEKLITLIPIGDDVKRPFLKNLEQSYNAHKSFISNPLLATIMLMTYREYAEIPEKIHVFYDWAFNVLFRRHDASKGMFARKLYSGLQIDDFSQCLNCFSARTYMDERFAFSDLQACEYIKDSLAFEGMSVAPQDVFKDMHESVSLLQRDGLNYVFAHRSFQEYFTAQFLKTLDDETCRNALDEIVRRRRSDSVPSLLKAIDTPKFERSWALPTISEIISSASHIDAEQTPVKFFGLFYEKWAYFDNGLAVYSDSSLPLNPKRAAINELYKRTRTSARDKEKDRKSVKNRLKKLFESGDTSIQRDLSLAFGDLEVDRILQLDFGTTHRNGSLEAFPDSVAKAFGWDKWAKEDMAWLKQLHRELGERVSSRRGPFVMPRKRSVTSSGPVD